MTNPNSPGPGNPDGPAPYGSAGGFVGALIGTGAGLYDSYQNRKTAKENTERTIAANKAEAELAYQRSIQMWNMQNLYNSPAEQMKRFGAAGLNPHLIYGQGSPGNATSFPQYQKPDIQYRYAAPNYGAAIQTVLPTLMAVGSWMQNMRLSEAEIQSKFTNVEKARQLIEFLEQRNPRALQSLDNALSMFPYQRSMTDAQTTLINARSNQLIGEYAWRYGKDAPPSTGTARLDYLKKLAEAKLKTAQASFTDFNITNPQALMQLVLGGVMSMAGQQMRLSTGGSVRRGVSSPKRVKTFYQNGRRRSQVVDY